MLPIVGVIDRGSHILCVSNFEINCNDKFASSRSVLHIQTNALHTLFSF